MKTRPVQDADIDTLVVATRGSSLFKSLDDNQLRTAVAQASLIQLEAGESLIRIGEPPQGLFLVLSGEIRVLMSSAAGGYPGEAVSPHGPSAHC